MKFCKTCGAQLHDNDSFCVVCGTAVEQASSADAPTDFYDTEATTVLNESEFDDKAEETTVLSDNSPYQSGNSYQNNNSYQSGNYYQGDNLYQDGNNQSEYANVVEKPSFKDCYIKFWKNYTNFSGRARRSEYWYVVLANILVSLVTIIPYIGQVIGSLYAIAILVPTLALMVRRLHDLGKDWYYLFFLLIPVVGQIILLVWFCTDSQVGANKFGENPKGIN